MGAANVGCQHILPTKTSFIHSIFSVEELLRILLPLTDSITFSPTQKVSSTMTYEKILCFFRLRKNCNYLKPVFFSKVTTFKEKKLTPMAVMYQVRYPSVSGAGADWRNLELSPLPLSKAYTFSSSGGTISHRSYATELFIKGRKHVYIQNILSKFHLWVSKWEPRILSNKCRTCLLCSGEQI